MIADDCMLPRPTDLLTRPDPSTPTGRRVALPDDVLQVPAGRVSIDVAPRGEQACAGSRDPD